MTVRKKYFLFLLIIFVFLSSCGANSNSKKSLNLSSKVNNIPFSLFFKGDGSDEISKKIEESAQKRGYGFYYYYSINTVDQLNKILTKYNFGAYPNNSNGEVKKIRKSFFIKNKLYIIFLNGCSGSKTKAYKLSKQNTILNITVHTNASLDLDIKTDCLIIGISKDFIGKSKDIKLIFD